MTNRVGKSLAPVNIRVFTQNTVNGNDICSTFEFLAFDLLTFAQLRSLFPSTSKVAKYIGSSLGW